MKKYFIHDGHHQIGPFSAAELIERGITPSTPVYTSGLGRYVTASEISALNDAFCNKTNPSKNIASLKVVNKKSTSFIKRMAIVVVALVVIIVPFVVYKLQVDVPDAPLATSPVNAPVKPEVLKLKTALEQKEAANPLEYLSVHGKMHKNLSGKKIIKGSITNLASIASYKDIQMAVIFLSNNQEELQTHQFFLNDFVTPNNKISFRSVFRAPAETAGFRIKVLSATPMP
jgi:hypothetical protein